MPILWVAVIASFFITGYGIVRRSYVWMFLGWLCWAPLPLGLVTAAGFTGAIFLLIFHPVAMLGLWLDRRWIAWGALASPAVFMLQIGLLVLQGR